MSERIAILITDVVDKPIDIGTKGLQKLTFTGKDKEGKDIRYQTFKKGLFDAIREAKDKPNVEVDYKYEEKQVGDGDTFKNYTVSALYIDGKEVAGRQPYSGGGYRGKSPEEQASIESQVKAKLIVELRIADKITDDHPTYKKVLDWCDRGIPTQSKPRTSAKALVEKAGAKVVEEDKFDFDWWKENLDKTDYKEWLPETLKMMHITFNKTYVTTLKGMEQGQRQLIVNEIEQRLLKKEETNGK